MSAAPQDREAVRAAVRLLGSGVRCARCNHDSGWHAYEPQDCAETLAQQASALKSGAPRTGRCRRNTEAARGEPPEPCGCPAFQLPEGL